MTPTMALCCRQKQTMCCSARQLAVSRLINTQDKLVDYDIPSIRPVGGPNYVCDDIRDLNLIKRVTGWLPSGSGRMPFFFTQHLFHSQTKWTQINWIKKISLDKLLKLITLEHDCLYCTALFLVLARHCKHRGQTHPSPMYVTLFLSLVASLNQSLVEEQRRTYPRVRIH